MSDTTQSLIGLWNTDSRYGPGAQSDEVVVFMIDGTGRTEFVNFVLCTVVEFSWQIEDAGHLHIKWGQQHQISENGKSVDRSDSDRSSKSYAFSITNELTLSGNRMDVLKVVGLFWPNGPCKFGHVRRDVFGYEDFEFDLDVF